MSMSKDRVKFRLSDTLSQKDANVIAAARAFNISPDAAEHLFNVTGTIVCRPSQFARFLIYRSEMVKGNRFHQLNAELFTPAPARNEVDVSRNPRADEDC